MNEAAKKYYDSKLYKLKLHEASDFPPEIQVTRVAGGWLYRFWNDNKKEYFSSSTFVPFDNEFQDKNNH